MVVESEPKQAQDQPHTRAAHVQQEPQHTGALDRNHLLRGSVWGGNSLGLCVWHVGQVCNSLEELFLVWLVLSSAGNCHVCCACVVPCMCGGPLSGCQQVVSTRAFVCLLCKKLPVCYDCCGGSLWWQRLHTCKVLRLTLFAKPCMLCYTTYVDSLGQQLAHRQQYVFTSQQACGGEQ